MRHRSTLRTIPTCGGARTLPSTARVAETGRSIPYVGLTCRGAGIGITALDGLARLDVARGLSSDGRWRADLYFELR
jgi:hypothetical protein